MMESTMTQDVELHQLTSLAEGEGDPPPPPADAFDVPPANDAPIGGAALDAVQDVPVKVQAVLGRSRIPIGELLRLKTGMVMELDRRVGEPVDIFVNHRLIARGEVVMIDNSLGVTLTEIVQPER